MLEDRIKRANEAIEREGAKAIALQHARGGSGHGRAPLEIADAVTSEYETALADTMRLIAGFAQQSGLSIKSLSDLARPRCETIFNTVIATIRRTRMWDTVPTLHAEISDRFSSRLQNDFRNLEVGFIQGERIVEKPFHGIQGNAMLALKALYEACKEYDGPILINQLGLPLSEGEAKSAWKYLADKRLINEFNLPFTGKITAAGIDAIEGALRNPDASPKEFPSVTYNIVNNHIGSAVNSPIQQSGSHSTQTQTISYGQQQLDDLNRLVNELTRHMGELNLDAAQQTNALAQVGTIKSQLEATPNPVIVREAARSLRGILEGALGSLAVEAMKRPEVWDWIHHTLTIFSS
jgi:hypothetical protein